MAKKARWYRVRMRDGLEHFVSATDYDTDEDKGRGFLYFYKGEEGVVLAVPLSDMKFWGMTHPPQFILPAQLQVVVKF